MNTKIADLIKAEIQELNFIDKIAGVVKPLTYKDKDGNEKTFPVAVDGSIPCDPGHYTDLVPDSTKLSIIYFEDKGIDVVNAGCYYVDCEASLRLVCWCNLAKINANYTDAQALKIRLIQGIPRRLDNSDWATKILVMFEGEEQKSRDIFSAYTYDESKDQFLMYPYDYFALNYKIKYSIPLDTSCISEVILNPKIC